MTPSNPAPPAPNLLAQPPERRLVNDVHRRRQHLGAGGFELVDPRLGLRSGGGPSEKHQPRVHPFRQLPGKHEPDSSQATRNEVHAPLAQSRPGRRSLSSPGLGSVPSDPALEVPQTESPHPPAPRPAAAPPVHRTGPQWPAGRHQRCVRRIRAPPAAARVSGRAASLWLVGAAVRPQDACKPFATMVSRAPVGSTVPANALRSVINSAYAGSAPSGVTSRNGDDLMWRPACAGHFRHARRRVRARRHNFDSGAAAGQPFGQPCCRPPHPRRQPCPSTPPANLSGASMRASRTAGRPVGEVAPLFNRAAPEEGRPASAVGLDPMALPLEWVSWQGHAAARRYLRAWHSNRAPRPPTTTGRLRAPAGHRWHRLA